MRLRRGGSESTFERGDDAARPAWDGLRGAAAGDVVIRATRAGDLVVHDEVRLVA
jgi:hypothetical protein